MKKLLVIDQVEEKVDRLIDEREFGADILLKVSSLEGKNLRLEKEVERLTRKVEDLQWQNMRENLVFYNLQNRGEDCEAVISTFMKDQMNIHENNVYSKDNITGEIRIDIAHQLGKKKPTNTFSRPIVVKFVTRKEKEMVLKHAKNLKGKQQYVSEQLPAEMRERRVAQNQHMMELRRDNPDRSANKIHFVKDILMHNGQAVDAQFEYNTLPKMNVVLFEYEALHHSEPIQIRGSIFQGHVKFIHSLEDAVKSRDALFQDESVASAEHIMYAYRIDTEDGIFETGNSDDGECNISKVLVKLLDNLKVENVFLAVSRIHQGPNLGKQRLN